MSAEEEEPRKVEWPGRFGNKRLRILNATTRRPHRYRLYRALSVSFSLALLAMVPLLGIARFPELVAMAVAIFVFFFVTFNVNLVAGRMFCGWGCPIGQLNRLTDDFKAQRSEKRRLSVGLTLASFAAFFSLSILLWWTTLESIFAWVALAVMTGAALIFARVWGWSFCRKACPIGLYYSVVQVKRPLGILFDRSRCTDEGACVRACPVELDARNLGAPKHGIGGFAIEGLTENSHCLRCGACVEACELVTSKLGEPALSFGRPAPEPAVEIPAMKPAETLAPHRVMFSESEPAASPAQRSRARWMTACAIALVLIAFGGYAAISARRASRYVPEETWTKNAVASRELEQPSREAVAMRSATAPSIVYVEIEQGAFSAPQFVAHARDRLQLTNNDTTLHTVHISNGPRSVIHVPLPPGMRPRLVTAPPPGTYRITCDSHSGEEAELLVIKQEPNR